MDRFEVSVKMADPIIVPTTILENARSALDTASGHVANYESTKNEGYLDNANNALDSILIHLPTIEKRPSTKATDAATEIIGEMRESAESQLAGLQQAVTDLSTLLATADRRANEIGAEVDRKSQAINGELQRFATRYEEEEELRRKAHKEAQADMEQETIEAFDRHEKRVADSAVRADERFKTILDDMTAKSNEALVSLEEDKQAAQRLVGIVGETGMITGWNRAANAARNEARLWNAIALASLIFAGWQAIELLAPPAKGDVVLPWEGILSRTILLAILGLIAGFAAKQASRANRVEEANRRYELQLASVGPFIAELDMPTKQAIKTKLVERMYGQSFQVSAESSDSPPVTAGQMLVDFVKQIPAIIKASKT